MTYLTTDEVKLQLINPCKQFKDRYHSKKYESTVRNLGNDIWLITGNTAIEHITPGQVGVLYDSDEVIGGGVIDSIGDMKVQ